MYRHLVAGSIVAVLAFPAVAADKEALTKESRQTVKAFFGQLKGKLEAAMKEGGPTNAISVCNKEAPAIAHTMSQQYDGKVARTSLKLRNAANAPDSWEEAVLKKFEERKAAGEALDTMDHAEIVTLDGKQTFRYMKVIPTGEVCLKCHGGDVAPPVVQSLDKFYPADKARGFKQGDIRGAFTLMKTL